MERIACKQYGLYMKPKQIPKIHMVQNEKEGAKLCGDMVKSLVAHKPDALICLPAGNSAISTYEYLVDLYKNGSIDFSCVKFVQLDEWLHLEDTSENCRSFLEKYFLNHIHVSKEQIQFFENNPADTHKACCEMDQYIHAHGGIDFILLGLGMNGHLGLNEPFVSWDNYTVVTNLDNTTKQVGQKYFTSTTSLRSGITLGMKHVFEAKRVVLQVFGQKKQDIVEELFNAFPDESIPGSALKLMSHAELVIDRIAAEKVKSFIQP